MALVNHGARQITLRDLINIGRELGISASDVREVVQQVGGNIQEAAVHLGHHVYDAFVEVNNRYNREQHRLSRPSESNLAHIGEIRNRHSQSNLPASEQAISIPMKRSHEGNTIEGHNMAGAPEEGGEQQVTKPHRIWRRFPNTETAALKYIGTIWGSQTSDISGDKIPFGRDDWTAATTLSGGGGGNWAATTKNSLAGAMSYANATSFYTPQLFQIRMTSPYNIFKKEFNNGVAGLCRPTWLSYFENLYSYYHVLECEWEIDIHFGIPVITGDVAATNYQHLGMWVLWKYTEQDDPPMSWTNKVGANLGIATTGAPTSNDAPTPDTTAITVMTDAGTTPGLNYDDFMRQGGWHKKYVSFDTITQVKTKLRGKYKYGQCKMDIKTIQPSDAEGQDTTAEGWSQVGGTPTFPELLSVVICWDNATYNDPTGAIKVPCAFRLETEHIVQFKDLKANYKFPTPELANSIGATSGYGPEIYFMRGAAFG